MSSISLSGSFAGVSGEILAGTLSWKNPNATFEAGTSFVWAEKEMKMELTHGAVRYLPVPIPLSKRPMVLQISTNLERSVQATVFNKILPAV